MTAAVRLAQLAADIGAVTARCDLSQGDDWIVVEGSAALHRRALFPELDPTGAGERIARPGQPIPPDVTEY